MILSIWLGRPIVDLLIAEPVKMQLSKELKPLFSSKDRSRGMDYHHRGRVYDLEVVNGVAFSIVHGSFDDYEVAIDLTDLDDEYAFECSCPRFADGYMCKHLWAVILRLDETGQHSVYAPIFGKGNRSKNGQEKIPRWRSLLNQVKPENFGFDLNDASPNNLPQKNRESEMLYLIDAGKTENKHNQLQLDVLQRVRQRNGEWSKLNPLNLSHSSIGNIQQKIDQQIARLLLGANREYADDYYYHSSVKILSSFSNFNLDPYWSPELCQLLIDSNRIFWTLDPSLPIEEFYPITSIDLENPATITLEVIEAKQKKKAQLNVEIRQAGKPLEDAEVVQISENGVMLMTDQIRRVSNPGALELWKQTRDGAPEIDPKEKTAFLSELAKQNLISRIKIPKSWKVAETDDFVPTAVLKLSTNPQRATELCGNIAFSYGETEVALSSDQRTFFDENSRCWFKRDQQEESRRIDELSDFPVVSTLQASWLPHDFTVHSKHLVSMVDVLGERGWVVHLHGNPVRQSGSFDIAIESGQDWFDLSVKVKFDDDTIALPQLLKAVNRKEPFVVLADGSHVRIADDIVRKYARIAEFGQIEGDNVRFRPTQAALLDAMLDSKVTKTDAGFRNFRKKLQSFDGIKPKNPPRGFQGKLRDYQTEGLGWLHFLNQFQMGGCLADDMGLGKTVQVLSLLEHRRTRRTKDSRSSLGENQTNKSTGNKRKAKSTGKSTPKDQPLLVSLASRQKRKPSIVVVPKSLIFNWIEEAAKFTPRMKILNYTGIHRQQVVQELSESGGFDVLITTYGTMRKDIDQLSQVEFDYAILDESQAIKNSKAQVSKASRLLKADHRLAMTGTPIENHLGELWSLFEFLNPGILGTSSRFAQLTNQKKNNAQEREETLAALSRALKPYFLRRTKEQVLSELPPKTEQTLYCEMLPSQKKAYQELKEYYRVKLAKKVETEGIGRSKIQVLEALLRLRQVACDPRLVDESAKAGAKVELLQQQLSDIISDGHKVLVFSQFTSFLGLIRKYLDKRGVRYEYLDGKSRKRSESVKRFQNDPSVQAFLISIKAGGHGLNLTAADYVFLLDPWWNPAVEAQAIDRAHRLGQNNPVIAYRMVCRDTVEEKILELQNSKKDLAEKVIRSDESLIRTLTTDDLQIIFG